MAVVIVAGLSFFLISERMLWNEQYETLITGVDSRKNAEDLEGFINSFVKDHPERSKEVEFESEIKKKAGILLLKPAASMINLGRGSRTYTGGGSSG